MSARELITDHLDLWTGAVTQKRSGGRGNNGKIELTGIKKLRELILELAVRGKLVEQDPSDEPASVLLERIAEEKARLVKEGKVKKPKKLPEIDEGETPFSIPHSWTFAKLGEAVEIVRGITFPASEKSSTPEPGRVACLRTSNVQDKIEWNDLLYIRDSFVSKSSQYIQEHDIVMSMANSRELVGKVAIIDHEPSEPTTFGGFLGVIRPILLHPRFLMAVLRAPHARTILIGSSSQTTNIANISIGKLNPFILGIPPIEEQTRIVDKVDELMALCDRLEQQVGDQLEAHEVLVDTLLDALTRSADAAEVAESWACIAEHFDTLFTTEASIDKLKQSILQLAVMGRLVEQDPNDEPASVLLERITEEKVRLVKEGKIRKQKPLPEIAHDEYPFEIPSGWAMSRMDDITNIISGIAKGKKLSGKKAVWVPYLRVANVQRGALDLSEVKEIEMACDEVEKYTVEKRDLLITEGGDWDKVGRTAIWNADIKPMTHQNHVFRARLILGEQNEHWIEKYLNSGIAREYFANSSKQTTNLASINKTQLRSCIVPVPPLDEQQRIVDKVDELMALCDQLKNRLAEAGATRTHLAEAVVEQAVN